MTVSLLTVIKNRLFYGPLAGSRDPLIQRLSLR